jgi:pimeloyl-ACP methyl ester carboxylesterase
MPPPTVRAILTRLPMPRAYLYGDRGEPDGDLAALAAAGVTLAAVADAGHELMIDNPDGFAAALAAAFGD